MKRLKKWCSVFLSLCMILAMFPALASPASAANASAKYEDVVQTEWYVPYIDYVVEHGLMTGTSNAAFVPNGKVTRAQYVQVLYAFAKKPSGEKSAGFSDVKAGKWYTDAVNWAASVGVTGGMTKTTFAPDREVTREQAATFFRAYAEKVAKKAVDESKDLSSFPDQASVSNYAVAPMKWAVGAGLISGIKSGDRTTLSPKGTLTRAQLATMMKAFNVYLINNGADNHDIVDKNELLLKVDDYSSTVDKALISLSGTYSIKDGTIKEIQYKLKNNSCDISVSDKGTANDAGKWTIEKLRLYPGNNEIEIRAISNSGNSASKKIAINYDEGHFKSYSEQDLSPSESFPNSYYANNTLLVLFDSTISGSLLEEAIKTVCSDVSGKVVGQDNNSTLYQIQISPSDESHLELLCDNVKKFRYVLDCFPDYTTSIEDSMSSANSVSFNDPWERDTNKADWLDDSVDGSNWWAEAVHLQDAWRFNDRLHNITIGVVDSGFNDKHEDLNIKVVSENNFVEFTSRISPGEIYYYDHGTHVAGIIGAIQNNNRGIAGVVGSNVSLLGYSAGYHFGMGLTTYHISTVIKGFSSLIARNARVINFSAGNAIMQRLVSEHVFHNIIKSTGNDKFILVQCAGNGSKNAVHEGWMCSFTDPQLVDRSIVVAAAKYPEDGKTYTMTQYSNYGDRVSIVAPGGNGELDNVSDDYTQIYSTLPGPNNNEYGYMSGTSMAAPIVTGVTALVWAANPSLTPKEVKDIIISTATTPVKHNTYDKTDNKYYLIDANAAVEKALGNATSLVDPLIIDDDNKVIKTEDSTTVDVLSIGNHHSAVIKKDGSLWMWGANCYGELGSESGSTTPRKTMDDVTSVSLGYYHSAAIKKDGTLWLWGLNDVGQIGDGSEAEQCKPKKVLDDTVKVSLGWNYSAAIKKDGTLWMWGNNSGGQLGDGTTESHKKPVKIMNDVVDVSCAWHVTAAVKKDGTLWIWGYGDYGELGLNETTTSYKPKKLMDGVASVSLSGAHSTGGHGAALKKDGTLWMWGSNLYGQLGKKGVGQFSSTPIKVLDDVTSVNLGFYHSAAIKKDGSLWLWGSNDVGQIGVGSCDYNAYRFYPSPVKVMDNAVSVSLGGDYSAALLNDGSLWMWGKNGSSQLGDGTKDISFYPKQIMASSSISVQNQ